MMRYDRSSPLGSNVLSSSTIRFVAPVLVSLSVMLIAAVVSIEVLSTMRAFVGGESLYSKGQKNATYFLAQYALSHSDADFRQYQLAISFPLGDRQARMALEQTPADIRSAREGFLKAGNVPSDIGSAILLIRLFRNVGPVRHAIDVWSEGDSYTMRLCAIADRLRPADGSAVSPEIQAATEVELNRINAQLTPLEAEFSSALGEIARLTRTLLVFALTAGTIITALLCMRVTRARVRERNTKEQGLARLTELYAALSQTSQLISRVGDSGRLFDELCRICVGTSGLNLAAVGLVKADSSEIDFVARHGRHPEHLRSLLTALRPDAPPGADALHLTLRSGRSSVLNRRSEAGDLFPSEAAFPLHCQNRLVGVLCVFSEEKQFFRQDIVELMEQLAMEASFALASLQREAERRHQSAMLADQNRLLSLIASGEDLPTIFTSLALFAEARSGRVCSVVALDVEGSRCSLAVAPSLPRSFALAMNYGASAERHEPCFQAIRSGGPVFIPDLAAFPLGPALSQTVREEQLKSASAWPIPGNKGQAIGALTLYSRGDAEPAPLDQRLIGICASVAGIAIESCWAAERIRHLAHHDELTGLPNRLLFGYQLPQALARAQRSGQQVAVFFIDLDRFKVINDTLGHDAGDHVLRQIGMHLQECVRATDTLARVGGDEFALMVEQFGDMQELIGIAQKLLSAMSRPFKVAAHEYRLSGSIGVAVYPKDGSDSSSLLKNADIAMYRAKAAGKNTYQFYADDIDVHSVDRLTFESELRQALDRREIEVHYQPKIDIASGRIAGAEALVRWRHPSRGMLLPGEFIFVAEEMGLIADIGTLVLETVCGQMVQWRAQRMPPMRVAMNLSAQQFADSRLVENLNRVLRDTGCDPHLLEFEITESVVMTNPERALHLLEKIKSYGITLAIDDFGTGHSSLAYLKRFPVDSIKIDYAFVRDIAADPNDLAITKAIIALGHSLDLKVVAEGVESAKQLDILRRFHCDEFQGFLFSGALPAESFTSLLLSNAEAGRADSSFLSEQELSRLG
jgi:diguanylate cyclase (GGDEF)-like protein